MTVEAASTASGKVVDGSALARSEAVRTRPGDVALIDYFLAAPNVLTRAAPDTEDVRAIDQHHDHGLFDPVTTWITRLARRREWPGLTGDTSRVRRIDTGVDVDEV